MRIKFGTDHHNTSIEIWYALGVLDMLHKESFGEPIEITSMTDGTHMSGSLHYKGLAADIRTRDLNPFVTRGFQQRCLSALFPLGFDVVLEPDHIHVEYDPKPGRALLTLAP